MLPLKSFTANISFSNKGGHSSKTGFSGARATPEIALISALEELAQIAFHGGFIGEAKDAFAAEIARLTDIAKATGQ